MSRNTTVLFGGSILNEFFKDGNAGVVDFLKMIKNTFPYEGLCFIVLDYHGKLTYVNEMNKSNQHTILHDGNSSLYLQYSLAVAQAVSGQGIPPPDTEGWSEIYHDSGWKLADRIEYHSHGMDSFLHVLVKN